MWRTLVSRPWSVSSRGLGHRFIVVRPCAQLAAVPGPDPLQEQWASIQAFFESTHFGSVQHRCGAELEEVLRHRFHVERQQRGAGLELRPLDARVDPNKRIDPVDLMYRWARNSEETTLPRDALLELLDSGQRLLLEDARPLLDLRLPHGVEDAKLVIVGDTHGQLLDVLHIFHTHGPPSESTTYVFNGDIADRGPQAVEILILVLAFKLRFPRHVHFLRGNHENRAINERPRDFGGGFLQECLEKYGEEVFESFQGIFACLPLFAVVEEEVFVVHAGLFRTPNVTLDSLRTLSSWRQHYPMLNGTPVPQWSDDESILFDAQWGDPHPTTGFRPSKRGPGVLDFGRDVTEDFLDRNGLSLCIRSHECPRSGRGFAYTHGRRLLTVFSASNYGGVMGNRGAVAVLRPGVASSPLKSQQISSTVNLEVVEHDISTQSPESGSDVFRQASLARRVTKDCPLMQPALAILIFNREALRARCQSEDITGSGFVPKAFLMDELKAISTHIDWQRILNDCLDVGPDVAYGNFLDALRVRWMYSTAEQAAKLAKSILEGELPVQDLAVLLGMQTVDEAGGERCTVAGGRHAAKLISPDIAQWQLEDLVSFLGCDGRAAPTEFVARLMLFAPPFRQPPEAWMQDALSRLEQPLRKWAGAPDINHAACHIFTNHSPDNSGLLTVAEMTRLLEDILLSSDDLNELDQLLQLDRREQRLDSAKLEALVLAMDANGNGRISFLELLRALSARPGSYWQPEKLFPPELLEAVAAHAQRNTGLEEFLFSHRGALLRGCRFADTHGSGLLPPEVFLQVSESLAEVVGCALSQRQTDRLRTVLGSRLVPYALALSRFEKVLEKDEASPLS